MPTNCLKIPKSVHVTGFPLSSFKYLVYLAKLCCDSKDEVLVDGRSSSRSCRLAVGVVGVIDTFSLLLPCVIPHVDSCTIFHAVHQRHHYKFDFLSVMAGDCGDKIHSKSKQQPAGVTSCANFENVLHVYCFSLQYVFTLQFSIFAVEVLSLNVSFYCIFREFCEFSFGFAVQTLRAF